jgi:hypothetical protein
MKSLVALAPLLTACTALLPANSICPPGQGPAVGATTAQPLASGENHPVAIAVLGGTMFWLDQGPPAQEVDEGSVVSREVCSGVQRVLARKQSRPTALVLNVADGHAYWVNGGRSNASGQLCRVAIDGSETDATCLLSGEARPSAIALDGGSVYFTDKGDLAADGTFVPGSGSLRRYDLASGAVTTVVDTLDAPTGVIAANGVVTWTSAGRGALVDIDGNGMPVPTFAPGSGAVERWQGGQRTVVGSALDSPVALASSPTHLYWIDRGVLRGTGRLHREDLVVTDGLDFPGGLAVDGTGSADQAFAAVTGAEDEDSEGRVSRLQLGVPEQQLASDQQLPKAIAVDHHLLYWVNYGHPPLTDGQVVVLSRTP